MIYDAVIKYGLDEFKRAVAYTSSDITAYTFFTVAVIILIFMIGKYYGEGKMPKLNLQALHTELNDLSRTKLLEMYQLLYGPVRNSSSVTKRDLIVLIVQFLEKGGAASEI